MKTKQTVDRVDLYETNAEFLYMVYGDDVYDISRDVDVGFDHLAAIVLGLVDGDLDGAKLDPEDIDDNFWEYLRHVATYNQDGSVDVLEDNMGILARQALNIIDR